MTTQTRDPVVVVVELNGGNDYLNTVVPYTDPNYHDNRVKLRLTEDEVHKIDDRLGFQPYPRLARLLQLFLLRQHLRVPRRAFLVRPVHQLAVQPYELLDHLSVLTEVDAEDVVSLQELIALSRQRREPISAKRFTR